MKNNDIEILKINEIFKNRKYIIPIYQRPYAWGEEEIKQLLDDIFSTEKEYFIGSLVVNEKDGVYEVIDGQQRLTTLYLLFSVLNIKYNKCIDIKIDYLKFEARDKSNVTIDNIENIIHGNDNEKDKHERGITNGINVITNVLNEKENEIKTIDLEKIKILKVLVPDKTDLNKYFEIMNTRGEQLEPHQIVKANIMGLFKNKNERDLISVIWDACANMDSYVQMNIYSTKLRKKIFSRKWDKYKCNGFKDLVNKYNETIKEKNPKSEYEQRKNIDGILGLNNNIDEDKIKTINEDDKNIKFESIISFPNFLLHVARITNNMSDDVDDINLDESKLLEIMKPFCNEEAKVNAKKFIYNLLYYRFKFDNYIIKRDIREDKEGKWSLKKLESQNNKKLLQPYYDKNTFDNVREIILLQSALRITYTSPKTMHWITKVLMYVNENENMRNEDLKEGLIKELEVYVKERINDAIEIINNNGSYYIQSKDNNKEEINGFKVPRIVFTYLDYLLAIDNNRFKSLDYLKKDKDYINNFSFKYRNSIEHFHPQHQNEDQQKDTWKNANDNDEKFIQKINDFGNLALVTVEGNSALNNASAEAKIKGWENIIKQSPKFVLMAEKAKEEDGWTYEKCVKHRNDMLKILQEDIKPD